MLSISLNRLRFHAFHGVYPEEKQLGNEYEVDVDIRTVDQREVITALDQTIDYVRVYEIVSKRMQVATPLLETVAMELAREIRGNFDGIREINISIRKLHLPIPNFAGQVTVSYTG